MTETFGKRKADLRAAEDDFMAASAEMTAIRKRYKKEDRQFIGQPDYDAAEEKSMKAFEELERVRRKYGLKPL